jgi:hypothetical protein
MHSPSPRAGIEAPVLSLNFSSAMMYSNGRFDREHKLWIYAELEFRFDVEAGVQQWLVEFWSFNNTLSFTFTYCSQAKNDAPFAIRTTNCLISCVADST